MTEQQVFDVWAPLESPWSNWAKPVLFAQLEHAYPSRAALPMEPHDLPVPPPDPARPLAIVIDLPASLSVLAGLQLARQGFRPVPLFNTSHGVNGVVPVRDLITALRFGADVLQTTSLSPDAPPAFLIDSNRMQMTGAVLPGKYDNRWLVFPQDFPSARFLKQQRIEGVVLIQEKSGQPASDLAHVLLRWQEAGIPILSVTCQSDATPQPVVITKPLRYRALWYHFLAVIGLHRNSAGGFGAVIPEPSQGGGFG